MSGLKKIYHQLKLRRIDTLVYAFNLLKDTIPVIQTPPGLTTERTEKVNQTLFAGLMDGNAVSKNYVYKKNLLSRQLGYTRMPLIGGCSTIEAYRGRGIYPFMLTQILQWHKNHITQPDIAIFVAPDNIASIKGIEKAGFRFVEHVTIYRLLGMCIYKKVHAG